MDENKSYNGAVGEDNESILAKKKSAADNTPPSPPAYASRREGAQGQRGPAPAGAPQRPQNDGARPAPKRPPQASQGQQRPAMPQRPGAQTPPQVRDVRPAPSQRPESLSARPSQGAVQNGARPARPAPADNPAYRQRRAPTGGEGLPAEQNKTMVAPSPERRPAPKQAEKSAPVSVPKKEKAQEKKTDKQAGADMMVSIVKAMIYMVVILVVSVFISIYVIRVGNDVFAFVKSDEAVDVTIPEDATVGEISEILHDNGIINFPGIFKMYASLKKDKGPFVAGDYTVSPSMSYDELRGAFKEQIVTGTQWITIPEGYTTDEIIDLLVENGIGKREKYIDVINNYDFDYWFIDELEKSQLRDGRVYRLEGYLFPDTYEFYKASSEEKVIARLLDRFDEVFVEDYRTKAAELGYTVDEILTIASLIEKEAGGAGDFMYVSSVFHNRLNNPTYYPRLESDATTVYAIQVATGKRPDKITPEDNKFEHPYNTYLNAGLTPGPITNPSASAIRYALYPAKTGYYYFITDNAGKVYYASGITEHTQNIALVKQINEQLEG